jgi:hypothetical protein
MYVCFRGVCKHERVFELYSVGLTSRHGCTLVYIILLLRKTAGNNYCHMKQILWRYVVFLHMVLATVDGYFTTDINWTNLQGRRYVFISDCIWFCCYTDVPFYGTFIFCIGNIFIVHFCELSCGWNKMVLNIGIWNFQCWLVVLKICNFCMVTFVEYKLAVVTFTFDSSNWWTIMDCGINVFLTVCTCWTVIFYLFIIFGVI